MKLMKSVNFNLKLKHCCNISSNDIMEFIIRSVSNTNIAIMDLMMSKKFIINSSASIIDFRATA